MSLGSLRLPPCVRGDRRGSRCMPTCPIAGPAGSAVPGHLAGLEHTNELDSRDREVHIQPNSVLVRPRHTDGFKQLPAPAAAETRHSSATSLTAWRCSLYLMPACARGPAAAAQQEQLNHDQAMGNPRPAAAQRSSMLAAAPGCLASSWRLPAPNGRLCCWTPWPSAASFWSTQPVRQLG